MRAAEHSEFKNLEVEQTVNPVDIGTSGELHNALLEELRLSGRLDIPVRAARDLIEHYKKIAIEDAPSRSLILGHDGQPFAVLFVSSTADASYVERNVTTAAEAKALLGSDLGSVILDPLAQGYFRGLSYAVWPWHRTRTPIRGLSYLQMRFLILPRLTMWLREATARTARSPTPDEIAATFMRPLVRMAQDDRFSIPLRDLARSGLDRLDAGAWVPRVVLEHKAIQDNLLLPRDRASRRRFPRGFILIDWAGAHVRGHAFGNLLRIGQRSRLPASDLRRELKLHCEILHCEARDIMLYPLAAAGSVGANLGFFSESFYVTMYQEYLQFSHSVVRDLL